MARIVLTAAVHVSQLCALRTEKVSSEGFKRGNGGEKEGAGMAPDCVICWEARANMVLVPCGHLCMCYECASSWARSMIKPAEVRGARASMSPDARPLARRDAYIPRRDPAAHRAARRRRRAARCAV